MFQALGYGSFRCRSPHAHSQVCVEGVWPAFSRVLPGLGVSELTKDAPGLDLGIPQSPAWLLRSLHLVWEEGTAMESVFKIKKK